ncbi:MAG: hypothetical protein AAGG02_06815 [Cyanobacteria bacterium P01_H01_bin.15]
MTAQLNHVWTFAQIDSAEDVAISFAALLVQIIFFLAIYFVMAYFIYRIYQRLNVENPWYAFIPVLGYYPAFIAGEIENPILWTVLTIVPCVNIISAVFLIMAWVKVFNKLNKSPWLLLLCLIPLGALFVFGYAALY